MYSKENGYGVNILLVEDDEALNRGICFKLEKEGFKVFSAKNIAEARESLDRSTVGLIILDVTLPDGNGFDFCREIRKTDEVLVIFLTACDQEVDIVTGYDLGGDDYITKPFSLMVLLSKINALLRRNTHKTMEECVNSGDISFYPQDLKVLKREEQLSLSKMELKLLKYFMDNAGMIVSKDQLLNELWDIDGAFVDQNTIAVNVRRLREKIEDNPSEPKYIKNVRGIGYIWAEGCSRR